MRYSLNQIEHTVRKAARGSGLSWGVAEDAGRAARWLHMVDLPGVSLVASVLAEIDHSDDQTRKVAQANVATDESHEVMALKPIHGRLSPLVVGPCIGDWVNAIEAMSETNETEIAIENVVCPLLLAGYCGVAAQQTQLTLSIHWHDFQMRCAAKEMRYLGEKIGSNFEPRIRVSNAESNDQNPCANATVKESRIGSVEVDSESWRQLEMLSHQTYVEATESSRLSGAGAGLNDND